MSDRDHDGEPLEPLPTELRDLLAPERAAGAAPGKARVRARLDASLFGGPSGGGGNGGGGGSTMSALSKAAAIFAAGAIVGGAVVAIALPPRTEIVERVIQAPAPTASSSSPASESATTLAPTVTHPLASASASAPASASASAPAGDTLAQERALLDPARTAIGRRDGMSALEAVRRHEAKYPSGKLAEEREAIAVQALVLVGRRDEARVRATKFQTRWPDSVLGPTVRAATE